MLVAGVGAVLAAIGIWLFLPVRWRRTRVVGVETNPAYDEYAQTGARWKRRMDLSRAFVGGRGAGGGSADGDFEPSGLMKIDYVLNGALEKIRLLRRTLRARADFQEEAFEDEGPFTASSIAMLYERSLRRAFVPVRSAAVSTADVREDAEREGVASALGDGWMSEVYRTGPDSVLARLEKAALERFDQHAQMTLNSAFRLLDELVFEGSDAVAGFFEGLSRNAALLWPASDELSGTRSFIRYGPPWTEALVAHGKRVIGNVQSEATHRPGSIVLTRIARGSSWVV